MRPEIGEALLRRIEYLYGLNLRGAIALGDEGELTAVGRPNYRPLVPLLISGLSAGDIGQVRALKSLYIDVICRAP